MEIWLKTWLETCLVALILLIEIFDVVRHWRR